jgi:hypothetical protein
MADDLVRWDFRAAIKAAEDGRGTLLLWLVGSDYPLTAEDRRALVDFLSKLIKRKRGTPKRVDDDVERARAYADEFKRWVRAKYGKKRKLRIGGEMRDVNSLAIECAQAQIAAEGEGAVVPEQKLANRVRRGNKRRK